MAEAQLRISSIWLPTFGWGRFCMLIRVWQCCEGADCPENSVEEVFCFSLFVRWIFGLFHGLYSIQRQRRPNDMQISQTRLQCPRVRKAHNSRHAGTNKTAKFTGQWGAHTMMTAIKPVSYAACTSRKGQRKEHICHSQHSRKDVLYRMQLNEGTPWNRGTRNGQRPTPLDDEVSSNEILKAALLLRKSTQETAVCCIMLSTDG